MVLNRKCLKVYKEDNYLQISGIQHFYFCKRQWALIHIENQWNENFLTAEGRNIHENAHDEKKHKNRGSILTYNSMHIKSDKLEISGVCDVVEFIPDENGISIFGHSGCWRVRPVEYKHGKNKTNDCDKAQVVCQALCLEEMLCCEINEAVIYYFETKHREIVDITDELRMSVINKIMEMHNYFIKGYTPNVKPSKACEACSLSDICMPNTLDKGRSVHEYIKMHIDED